MIGGEKHIAVLTLVQNSIVQSIIEIVPQYKICISRTNNTFFFFLKIIVPYLFCMHFSPQLVANTTGNFPASLLLIIAKHFLLKPEHLSTEEASPLTHYQQEQLIHQDTIIQRHQEHKVLNSKTCLLVMKVWMPLIMFFFHQKWLTSNEHGMLHLKQQEDPTNNSWSAASSPTRQTQLYLFPLSICLGNYEWC